MIKLKHILIFISVAILLFVLSVYISVASTQKQFDTCNLIGNKEIDTVNFRDFKKVTVQASELYKSNPLKTILQGENYRKAWSTPVQVPILFLDTLKGGVKIVKEGGGKQTQSLRLQAADGTLYSLRSINKNPKKLIPEFAKNLGLENIIIDGISSQHPYAAPVVARMADHLNIFHTHPKIVYVPKQESLLSYNITYGNRLYMLEYETEGPVNYTSAPHVIEISDTERLQKLKNKFGQSLTIDKGALIKARLFDMIIGDWDRHSKQWGWVVQKKDSSYIATPLPGDRDNAFFVVDGIIPSLISNKYAIKEVRPFDKEIDFMEGLVYDFDVYFLQNTDKELFLEQAHYIQENLSNKKIKRALRLWNKELYELYGDDIYEKIRARRDNLLDIAKRYKNVIDKRPLLSDPLKGTDDFLPSNLIKCFDCD
ncbi:MAG: hypothetical protein HKN90_08740 [Flavobacteriaceae bacterium]|nr:hypothetical protein [Flavobacteriaceae bacterium]